MNLSTNHNMRYPKDVVRHSDVMIKPNTHDNLQHSTVSYPSDPSKSLLLWEYGDVATFEVRKVMLLAHDENCLLLSRPASSVLIYFATSTYIYVAVNLWPSLQAVNQTTLLAGS